MALRMGEILREQSNVSSAFNLANQNLSNALSSQTSLIRQGSQINQAQESLSAQMFRNEQARQDAKELEQRRRFESDRNFFEGVMRDRRDFRENNRRFGQASASQLLQAKTSTDNNIRSNQASLARLALNDAYSTRRANTQKEAQAADDKRRLDALIKKQEAEESQRLENKALFDRAQSGDSTAVSELLSRKVPASSIKLALGDDELSNGLTEEARANLNYMSAYGSPEDLAENATAMTRSEFLDYYELKEVSLANQEQRNQFSLFHEYIKNNGSKSLSPQSAQGASQGSIQQPASSKPSTKAGRSYLDYYKR